MKVSTAFLRTWYKFHVDSTNGRTWSTNKFLWIHRQLSTEIKFKVGPPVRHTSGTSSYTEGWILCIPNVNEHEQRIDLIDIKLDAKKSATFELGVKI